MQRNWNNVDMAIRDIILYGHPTLRLKANAVEQVGPEIDRLVEDMIETMLEAEGIGLAAPQVNEPLALCVVNSGLIEEGTEPKAYLNPVVLESSGEATMEEGCLSIPDIREDVNRPERIKIRYQDLSGQEHVEECDGMLARVLQHEIDHLNGILFIDYLSPMKRKLLAKRLKRIATGS